MKYILSAIVEKEDNEYFSHCIDLGVSSQGRTIEEALKNLQEAAELYLEHADEEEIRHLGKVQKAPPIK